MTDIDGLIDGASWGHDRRWGVGDARGDMMVLMVERGHTPHFPMEPSDFWGPPGMYSPAIYPMLNILAKGIIVAADGCQAWANELLNTLWEAITRRD